jgi:hypothetical protein
MSHWQVVNDNTLEYLQCSKNYVSGGGKNNKRINEIKKIIIYSSNGEKRPLGKFELSVYKNSHPYRLYGQHYLTTSSIHFTELSFVSFDLTSEIKYITFEMVSYSRKTESRYPSEEADLRCDRYKLLFLFIFIFHMRNKKHVLVKYATQLLSYQPKISWYSHRAKLQHTTLIFIRHILPSTVVNCGVDIFWLRFQPWLL